MHFSTWSGIGLKPAITPHNFLGGFVAGCLRPLAYQISPSAIPINFSCERADSSDSNDQTFPVKQADNSHSPLALSTTPPCQAPDDPPSLPLTPPSPRSHPSTSAPTRGRPDPQSCVHTCSASRGASWGWCGRRAPQPWRGCYRHPRVCQPTGTVAPPKPSSGRRWSSPWA